MPFTLDPRCEFGVLSEPARPGDEHEELGCGLQGPASRAVRRALDPLRKRLKKLGSAKSLAQAEELVAWAEAQPAYAALCTSKVEKGRRQLKSSVLYPKSELVPRVLHVRHGSTGHDYRAFDWQLEAGDWAAVHDFTAALSSSLKEPEIRRIAKQGGFSGLVDELVGAGWLANRDDDRAPDDVRDEGLFFVGHNSVLVSSGKTRVVIDPWFRPWRDADPPDFKPIRASDVGRVDAIAITHSHGDHFHLGSLLSFPRDTPIFVPYVARDSILSTGLDRLLADVGFTKVKALKWWESARVGDVTLQAMPFYGEQACAIELVDPELRNVGNTWRVVTPRFSSAFLADTGRDPAGSMLDVALEARRKFGPVDVLFGGMRGFALCPLFLPFTSLDAMFVNVPLELVGVKQKLMNDGAELLATAEVFGAKHVVPYADGGAPWYWREGMGPSYEGYPAYPGERDEVPGNQEDPAQAPFPERLVELADSRGSTVEPLVLRPGDLVRFDRKQQVAVGRVEGFAWPYAEGA